MASQNESLETQMKQSIVLSYTLQMLKKHIPLTILMILLIIVSSVSTMLTPYFIQGIIDHIQEISSLGAIFPLIIVAFVGSLGTFLSMLVSTFLIQKIILELRQKVVIHSLQQSMEYYNKEPLGRMVTRITKDLDEADNFYQTVSGQIIGSLISLVTVTTMLYILNKTLLLYALIGIPFIVFFTQFYKKKILVSAQRSRSQTSFVNSYLSEHLQGLLDLQLYNKTEESVTHFLKHNQELYMRERKLGLYQMFIRPFLNLTLIIMIVVVVIAGAYLANKTLVTVGTLFAFIQLIQSFFFPIITLAQVSAQIQSSVVSLERIFSFLQINTALHDPILQQANQARINLPQSVLSFSHVGFSYNTQKMVLKDINLELTPNKKTALVGHSGSGKTTITRLCMRFWDTTEGAIYFNGVNIKDIPIETLRSNIVLLEQDSFIFFDTIRENLTIGRNIDQLTLDTIAKKTGLDTLIARFDQGWDHVVNRKLISTGEQRLISISRVLVKPPAIILLDEFSATLDNQTELVIQNLIEELQQNRGSLIIAHRLNTIMQCDEILYIDNGSIIEQGTHTQLLARNGGYAQLIQNMEGLAKK